jgi:hypothetical protein
MIFFQFMACSSAHKNVEVPLMQLEPEDFTISSKRQVLQKPMQIRNSLDDRRPGWTHRSSFEEKGSIFFTGGFLKGDDYSVTVRCAQAEATKIAVGSISQYIRAEFSMFTQGANNIESGTDRYIEDGIATFTRNLHIQGIQQVESYYEEMSDPVSMDTYYNAWVKLKISSADYNMARAGILKQLRDDFDRAGEIEAKEKAQRLLTELKEQIGENI